MPTEQRIVRCNKHKTCPLLMCGSREPHPDGNCQDCQYNLTAKCVPVKKEEMN